MAIKFAQKTSDVTTPPAAKAPVKEKSAETAKAPIAQAEKSEDGTDLFETKAETPKRKKKR